MYLNDPITNSAAEIKQDSQKNYRLLTDSKVTPTEVISGLAGASFSIYNTVTITSANESGLVYLKQTQPFNLVITKILFFIGVSTGGTGTSGEIYVYHNPNGTGTLATNAAPVTYFSNDKMGLVASETFLGQVYGNNTGGPLTVLGGNKVTYPISNLLGKHELDLDHIILPQGTSLALGLKSLVGNTSQSVLSIIHFYRSPS